MTGEEGRKARLPKNGGVESHRRRCRSSLRQGIAQCSRVPRRQKKGGIRLITSPLDDVRESPERIDSASPGESWRKRQPPVAVARSKMHVSIYHAPPKQEDETTCSDP